MFKISIPEFENYKLKITAASPRGQWVNEKSIQHIDGQESPSSIQFTKCHLLITLISREWEYYYPSCLTSPQMSLLLHLPQRPLDELNGKDIYRRQLPSRIQTYISRSYLFQFRWFSAKARGSNGVYFICCICCTIHWPLGDLNEIKSFHELMNWVCPAKWLPGECHRSQLMIHQHRFREWLGAVRQQAFTWANVDPDLGHHMASLGHNELKAYMSIKRGFKMQHFHWFCWKSVIQILHIFITWS